MINPMMIVLYLFIMDIKMSVAAGMENLKTLFGVASFVHVYYWIVMIVWQSLVFTKSSGVAKVSCRVWLLPHQPKQHINFNNFPLRL